VTPNADAIWLASYGITVPAFGGTDWSCAAAGTAAWTAGGGAALSKVATGPGGINALRIAGASGFAYQAGTSVASTTIRYVGKVRGDGTGIPIVMDASLSVMWQGTASATWRDFDVEFPCNGTALPILYTAVGGVTEWCLTSPTNRNATSWAPVVGTTPLVQVHALAPRYSEYGFAGNPGLLFNGTTHFMTADAIGYWFAGSDTPFTITMAGTINAPALLQCLWSIGDAANQGAMIPTYNAGAYKVYRYDDTGASATATGGAQATVAQIMTVRFNGTTVDMWIDGVKVIDGAALNVGVATPGQFTLGGWRRLGVIAAYTAMSAGGIVVSRRAITDAEVAAETVWLQARCFDLPATLGGVIVAPYAQQTVTVVGGLAASTIQNLRDPATTLSAPSAPRSPGFDSGVLALTSASDSAIVAASGGVTGNASHAQVLVVAYPETAANQGAIHTTLTQGVAAGIEFIGTSGQRDYQYGSDVALIPHAAETAILFTNQYHVHVRLYDSNRVRTWIDGQQIADAAGAITLGSGAIGLQGISGAANDATIKFAQWIPTTLTDAQIQQMTAWAVAKFGLTQRTFSPRTAPMVCHVGDSLTQGNAATLPEYTYPAQMLSTVPHARLNQGVGSSVIGDAIAAAWEVDAAYDATRTCVLVMWHGTNDIALGESGADTHAELAAYCAARRAIGWKVVVGTLPAIDYAGITPAIQAEYAAYRTAIQANHATYSDAWVDIGADARMADAWDATYRSPDRVHFTDAGFTVVASLFGPVVQSLL
jgi:lysophospholipase L1-like esterase